MQDIVMVSKLISMHSNSVILKKMRPFGAIRGHWGPLGAIGGPLGAIGGGVLFGATVTLGPIQFGQRHCAD